MVNQLLIKIGCAVAVFRSVQNKGCRFKVSLKNDGFSLSFKDFCPHYYNGANLKSGHLSLKSKKVCTPLEVLSLYQTCRTNMVEAMGFEPMTSWSRTKRATKLHHASIKRKKLYTLST